jgi:hypothetical protein
MLGIRITGVRRVGSRAFLWYLSEVNTRSAAGGERRLRDGVRKVKSFLVPVGGAGSDDAVLETAMAAARPFAAHLNFLHVQVGAGQAARHSPHADFATGPALHGALADLETEAKVRTSAAEQHVREFCTRSNITMLNARGPTPLVGDAKEEMTASWRVETRLRKALARATARKVTTAIFEEVFGVQRKNLPALRRSPSGPWPR